MARNFPENFSETPGSEDQELKVVGHLRVFIWGTLVNEAMPSLVIPLGILGYVVPRSMWSHLLQLQGGPAANLSLRSSGKCKSKSSR